MRLCEYLAAALVIQQLVAAQENSPGLRLTTGLGALLGDLPMSSSLPALPPLPALESCDTSDISLPLLPPLASGDCLPPLPVAPCESVLPSLPVPSKPPCFCKRSPQLRRRCKCQGIGPIPCGYGLPSALLLPPPTYQQPYLPSPCLEPYPPLRPKTSCLEARKKKQASTKLMEKIILKKGLTLGLGPDCAGSDIGLLPDAFSTFAVDALVGPLVKELDDCSF